MFPCTKSFAKNAKKKHPVLAMQTKEECGKKTYWATFDNSYLTSVRSKISVKCLNEVFSTSSWLKCRFISFSIQLMDWFDYIGNTDLEEAVGYIQSYFPTPQLSLSPESERSSSSESENSDIDDECDRVQERARLFYSSSIRIFWRFFRKYHWKSNFRLWWSQ